MIFYTANHTHNPLPMKWMPLLCLIVFLVMPGCEASQHEKELEKKARELQQKEEELQAKELALNLKEKELAQQVKSLDSTRQDSTFIYDPNLIGLWVVKMECIETTCPGSAVGDTKTEEWELSYQGDNIVAKALVGGNLIRVYRGIYTGNTLELIEGRQGTAKEPATKMVVRLRMTGKQTMEGQRDIIRDGYCKTIYAVSMSK